MNILCKVALYGWTPLVMLLFWLMPARRAVIWSFVLGWLFLPMLSIPLKGIPDLSKITVTSMAALAGALAFDFRTVLSFRPKLWDIPMFVLCASPWVTAQKNMLGNWEAASSVLLHLVVWGMPYFLGRIYFKDWDGFRQLGTAIFIGGLLYVPLCLLESKISPQLHRILYGKLPGDGSFAHNYRWGGYRPVVFMQTGLATAMWMITASLVGTWMWVSGSLKKVAGVPMSFWIPLLLATTFWCKSTGALVLLAGGLATLFWIKWTKNALPILVLLAIPPIYMYERATLHWDGTWIAEKAHKIFGDERAVSLEVRINAENAVTQQALLAPEPNWGWGRYDPVTLKPGYVPRNENGISGTITDGLWMLTLGQYGIIGLAALTATTLMAGALFWLKVPPRFWAHPMTAAPAAMAILLLLHTIDNILNAMINPIFVLGLGGIVSLTPTVRQMIKDQKKLARFNHARPSPSISGIGRAPMTPAAIQTAGFGARAPSAGAVRGFPAIPGLRASSAPSR